MIYPKEITNSQLFFFKAYLFFKIQNYFYRFIINDSQSVQMTTACSHFNLNFVTPPIYEQSFAKQSVGISRKIVRMSDKKIHF